MPAPGSNQSHLFPICPLLKFHQRIAPLPAKCYHSQMHGLTIKLDSEQIQWVQGQAEARRCSKAAVVREIIDERRITTDEAFRVDRRHSLG